MEYTLVNWRTGNEIKIKCDHVVIHERHLFEFLTKDKPKAYYNSYQWDIVNIKYE